MSVKFEQAIRIRDSKLDLVSREIERLNHCAECGAKLMLDHASDYKSLVLHETAQCLDCGKDNRNTIHMIN